MDVPERLTRKIAMFKSNGTLTQDQLDIFLEPSWLQVMLGQGITPEDYHPLADRLTESQLKDKMSQTLKLKREPLPKIPSHDEFLKIFGKPV